MISLKTIDILPVEVEDAWKVCNFAVANEHRMKRYFPITLEQNLTPDLSRRFTTLKSKEFANNEEYLFVAKPKDGKSIVALVYIKELDWDKKQGEFAYCVDYNWEGKGITTQMVRALSNYAFQQLDLEVLQIIVHKENTGSVRVAEKCNFIWQRTLKNEYTPPGESPLDMELYELYK
ncbi:GNAT family protein [Flavobacteriaceae bacterium S356]|uniref:GNAT family protein n=1 Tax=Asprobacillus argus TaxID=3076534 RepID=A0ABU3LGR6_9FLAO|nr:GNAT family protein [Flavobacteriaceae bacterium S356]